jgi:hypothetical protein
VGICVTCDVIALVSVVTLVVLVGFRVVVPDLVIVELTVTGVVLDVTMLEVKDAEDSDDDVTLDVVGITHVSRK